MKNPMPFLLVLSLSALLLCSSVYAQQTGPATSDGQGETEQSATDEKPIPGSQEVEVNEDIYRQFMELKNARQQRNILPEEAFKPGSGSQKLDELPEESQKHLRNQLREIIVQGAPWQPGDETKAYAYAPSAAAANNPQLQKQEAEAWGELLDSYHKREAQIYENSARTAAAMASENSMNGTGGGAGNQQGSPQQGGGQAANGTSSQSQKQAGDKSQQADDLANSAKITSTTGTAGVSQNAMEFLKRMESSGGANDSANQAENGNNGDTGSGSEPGGPLDEPTQVTQQSPAEENTNTDPASEVGNQEATAESLAETSQNALEFLKQNGEKQGDNPKPDTGSSEGQSDMSGEAEEQIAQSNSNSETDETGEENSSSTPNGTDTAAGSSQSALEYLTGATQGQQGETINPADMSGTLSIEDLVNARGVRAGKTISPPGNTGGKQDSGVKPPKKDDDG